MALPITFHSFRNFFVTKQSEDNREKVRLRLSGVHLTSETRANRSLFRDNDRNASNKNKIKEMLSKETNEKKKGEVYIYIQYMTKKYNNQ